MQEAKGNPTIPKHTAQTYKKPTFYYFFFQIKKAQNDLINTVFLQCCISVDAGSTIVQRVGNNVLPLVLTVI